MNKQHSPFSLPRKDLFSALQRNLFIIVLLLFCGAFVLYKLMDMSLEERNHPKDALVTLENRLHQAEINWLHWLSFSSQETDREPEQGSVAKWHKMLVHEYTEIETLLQSLNRQMPSRARLSVQNTLQFLEGLKRYAIKNQSLNSQLRSEVYKVIEQTNELDIKLIELEVAHRYQSSVSEYKLIWSPFVVLGFIAMIVIVVGTVLARRLSKGFVHLHYVLEKHKQGGLTVDQGYHKVDEFTDLGRLLDNELSSREFDYQRTQARLHSMQDIISQLDTPFLIANDAADVEWISKGFSTLWQANKSTFEAYFGIDEGLVGPVGEQLPTSLLVEQENKRLMLNEGVYRVHVKKIDDLSDPDKPTFSYLMTLVLSSELAELEVLKQSLVLMRQGIWDVPIRSLRDNSPFASFAKELEFIRESVLALFNVANLSQDSQGGTARITKLQQIATLLEAKINDNSFVEKMTDVESETDTVLMSTEVSELYRDELDSMHFLSQQIQDSVLIGFELLLQRLTLVEKDITNNVMLLSEVDRCLSEVRAGVLASLSAADGESEQVRHRFSLDLNHDIDGVQKHIESIKSMTDSTLSLLQTDHSVGEARLERAKQSVSELCDRINGLLDQALPLETTPSQKIEFNSADGGSRQINES